MRTKLYKIEVLVDGQWRDYNDKEYTAREVCDELNGLNLMTYANGLQYRKAFLRNATVQTLRAKRA